VTASLATYGHQRGLRAFPTRRSSDLDLDRPPGLPAVGASMRAAVARFLRPHATPAPSRDRTVSGQVRIPSGGQEGSPLADSRSRSEEHTSELQSRENLVCRLLLGKKK